MPVPDIKVRMAQDVEAPIVSNLVSEIFDMGGWMPEFEKVFPYWLVAEIAGEIVGTINLRISIPITSLELLSTDPRLNKKEKSMVSKMLIDSGVVLAAASGSTVISSMIPNELASYLEVALNRGYVIGAHGSIVFGRIK